MDKQLTGCVYDLQSFSVHDGPGIRSTVFLKGCPLKCPWCHSPESQSFRKQICFMRLRCVGVDICGECVATCPRRAIGPGDLELGAAGNENIRRIKLDRALCDDCGRCAETCYPEALFVSGKDYTVDELYVKVLSDLPFYRKSGGGVTVSGGEPMSQAEFTAAFLQKCTECGIHTALDTTGFAPYERYEKTLPFVNLFLYDLKHMESATHKKIIGVPNEPILENARKLAKAGARFQVRVPIIPVFNDSLENLQKTGEFCESVAYAVDAVQLLPYHPFGASKYERLQIAYPMPGDTLAPAEEKMEEIKALMLRYVSNVVIH
jgi:pyruvate formate lyase activating enzyme